jgi:hypothetical protein
MRSFTSLLDDKERPNGVILSVSEESLTFIFKKTLKNETFHCAAG